MNRRFFAQANKRRIPGSFNRAGALLVLGLLLLPVFAAVLGAFKPGLSSAAASSTLTFQARLLNTNGSLVADGTYNVEFKIYDTVASGASAQGVCSLDSSTDDCWWIENRIGANKVTVKNGYVYANLGSVTAFSSTIPWDQELWITMNIGGTGAPSWDGEMSPRFKVAAVPYAFVAAKLQVTDSAITNKLVFATPTASNKTITLPNETGTVCTTGSICSGYASATGYATISLNNIASTNLSAALNKTAGDLALQTTTSGNITLTTAVSGGLVNVLTGSLKVGNGTPGVTLNGEDLYVEGTLEVDGATQFDGALVATSTAAFNGGVTIGDAIGDTVTINSGAWTFANDTTVALTGGVNGLNFDSNTLSIDATNNRVGIGTAAPGHVLTVSDTSVATEGIEIAQQAGRLYFTDLNGGQQSGYIAFDNGQFDFYNSANRLTILAGGNVGVGGDATPDSLFSVGSTSQFQVNTTGAVSSTSSAGQVFFKGQQSGAGYAFGSGIFQAVTDNPTGASNIYFQGVTNGTTNFSVRADGQISTNGGYVQSGSTANTFTGASTFSAAGTGLAVTNNATIGGTLGVTGQSTFTGNINVNGGMTILLTNNVGYGSSSTTKAQTNSYTNTADKIRFASPFAVEYFDGASWVTWGSPPSFIGLTDGYDSTGVSVDVAHKNFRLIYNGMSCSYISGALMTQSYQERAYTFDIETSNDNITYASYASGSASGPQTVIGVGTGSACNDTYYRITYNATIVSAETFSPTTLELRTNRPADQGGTGFAKYLPFTYDTSRNITLPNSLTVTTGGATITAGNLALTAGNLTTAGTTRLTSAGVLQNVTNADASTFFTGGALTVARGGTGAGTFTSNGILFGNGTSALGVTAAGTTNQCLLANTGAAPTWGSCTAGGGVTTMAAIGAVPNANGATISTNTLTLQPADASFGGVVTTSTQTFAGDKTFSGALTVSGASTFNGGLTIGDAIGDTVTINSGAWTFANDTTVALTGGVNGLNFDSNTLSIDATNDRVGIGTAAPANELHVSKLNQGGGVGLRIQNTDTVDGNSFAELLLTPSSANTYVGGALRYYRSGRLAISSSGSSAFEEKLSILNTGNVGIGTTTIGTNNRLIVNAYSTVDNLATAQINTNAATNKGLVVQGFAAQSADLQQWQDSAGTVLAQITAAGALTLDDHTISRFDSNYLSINSGLKVVAQTAASNALHVRGAASQTADLLQFQDSAGTILTAFDATGKLVFGPSGAQDTNLYRSAADTLATDDSLAVSRFLRVGGTTVDTTRQLQVGGTHPGTGATLIGLEYAGTFPSTTITRADGLRVQPNTAVAAFTLARMNVVTIEDAVKGAGSTITDQYGLNLQPQTQGTNNYSAAIGASSTQTLWLSNNANNTTAAAGIAFGSSRDTNLYRSAADTLKTDDTFIAATALQSPSLDVASAGTLSLGTSTATAVTLGKAGITTTNSGALTVNQLFTGVLGATISGATINLNASSNFATNINTGTSNGAISLGNSAAGVITLQSASTIGLTGTSTHTGLSAGSGTALTVSNSTSTGSIFVAQDNSTAVLTVADGGGVIFRNSTNSTTAFQVQDSAGTSNLVVADTTNSKVGIATTPSSSGATVQVVGNVSATTGVVLNATGNSNSTITKSMVVSSTVNANDVVIIDTGSAGKVTTTSLSGSDKVFGIATSTQGSINQTQNIVIAGIYQVTADTGAIAIGDSLLTSATTGQVTASTAGVAGSVIGRALSSKTAGSSGLVWAQVTPGQGGNGVGNSNAIGTISSYSGSTAPANWLMAYGQAVSRSTYADLFAVIGTTYGVGDGSTTFNLPDLRGRNLVGLDNLGGSDAGRLDVANTLGGSGGEQLHTLTETEMPSHDHGLVFGIGDGTYTTGNPAIDVANFAMSWGFNSGSDGPHNVMDPYLLTNYIIRATNNGSGNVASLQGAYDGGNTLTVTNARDITITLADTATDSNFILNVASGSTSKFAVQYNGSDTFSISNAASAQGSALFKNATNNTTAFQIQNSTAVPLVTVDSTNKKLTVATDIIATGAATATTATTSGTGTNTTTLVFTAVTSFANNDILFIDNAGQDYYTRIVSGGTAASVTVSPAVTFETARTVTKYTAQSIGVTSSDYATLNNRFFQGYFLGGVVTGAGSTTLSDGNLSSSGNLVLQSTSGNVGIGTGTTTPASLLSVGSTSQFQVNSSGAIAASTGIANSGGYTQSGSTANTFTGASTFSAAGTALSVTNNATIGGTLVVQSSSVTFGTTSQAGSLIVSDGSSSTVTFKSATQVAATNYDLTVPAITVSDTFCLLTLANCGSAGVTLQAAYGNDGDGSDSIIALTTADDSIIFRNPSSSGTDSGFVLTVDQLNTGAVGGLFVSSVGTGALLKVTDATATARDVLTVADGGAATFRNQTNSTTAFQVQDSAGTSNLVVADTTNSKVGIATAPSSTGATVQVNGNVSATTGVVLNATGNSNSTITKSTIVTTAVTINDVVVIDTTTAGQVKTTTVGGSTGVFGIATSTQASTGQTQNIVIGGIYQVTADTSAVSIGDQLITSATAGQVAPASSPSIGQSIGRALSAKTAGSSGLVWVQVTPGSGGASVNDSNAVGAITAFSGSNAPSGWLMAYGQAVSRTSYSELFTAIGTTYGAGDGSTTFNLPDLRGRNLVAVDNMGGSDAGRLNVANTLGGTGGEQLHTMTLAELVSHTHTVNDPGHTHVMNYKDNGVAGGTRSVLNASSTSATDGGEMVAATTGISLNSAGSSTAFNVMDPYLLTNFIIKASNNTGNSANAGSTPTQLNAVADTGQTCTVSTNCTYDAISITLTPGTWVVSGFATMYSTTNADGKTLALYNVTDGAVVSNSHGAADDTRAVSIYERFSTSAIITVTSNKEIKLYGIRNGFSTINWDYPNGGITNTQRLSAYLVSGNSSGAMTLQGAYDMGRLISTTDGRDIVITLADTTTDSNFLINVASGSTSKFGVQYNGTDTFSISNAASAQGSALFKNATNNTTAFQIQNSTGTTLLGIDTTNNRIFTTIADGASAIGFKFNTPSYTTAGAKLISVQNNGVEKFSVDKDGKIASPIWKATTAVSYAGAALPRSGSFTSGGGTLMIFSSGSGFNASAAGVIGMDVKIDGVIKASLRSFTNEIASHKTFSGDHTIVTGIGAGSHTVDITAFTGTSTDLNDFSSVTIYELPY